MIILDTNVLSAMLEETDHPAAIAWLDRQDAEKLFTTTINVHELHFGLCKLAAGRRRARLERSITTLIDEVLANRILPLDPESARASGKLQAARELIGKPIDLGDCLIAGIAIARKAAIATRNIRHFSEPSLVVINPWDP